MKILKLVLGILFILQFGSTVHAQGSPQYPVIGGIPVHCTDSLGVPVYTYPGNVPDSAISTINSAGQRLIIINTGVLGKFPPLIQLFSYAHECGHHLSGDVVAGVYFMHDNHMREENADRIGIRLLRDQLHISPIQAKQIADVFFQNPPVPPYYLPGPLRSQWIMDCYNTMDNYCGHGGHVYYK